MAREAKSYTVGVAGESFQNEDGSDRQEIIRRCQIGEAIRLQREPDNPHDPNAVAVLRESGEQIGYMSSENAEWLADVLDRGKPVTASIKAINRNQTKRGELLGVVLDLHVYAAGDSPVQQTQPVQEREPEGRRHRLSFGTKTGCLVVLVAVLLGIVLARSCLG